MITDLGIFYLEESEPVFRHHFTQLVGPIRNSWTYYFDKSVFLQSKHQRRIACFQIPYPYDKSIEDIIDEIYDFVDCIVMMGSELHTRTVDFVRRYDRPKIRWFLCGSLNPQLVNSQTYKFLDWFTTSVHFYKNIRPSTLYSLNPYQPKPFVFDALLGRRKPHRSQAYDFINTNDLISQSITTYVDDHSNNFKDPTKWIWEDDGLEDHENVQWTVERIKYYGYKMSLSQVIPIKVYNQTAYSLVAETSFDNDFVFFTEKTVKPILARRLFILLSGRYALATLQELGFKTFDGIIDESYDSIEQISDRHQAALEQVKWLCSQDQSKILSQCRDIVDHNFNLMYGKDWYNEIRPPMIRILLNQSHQS